MTDTAKAWTVLTLNTIAFGICFACWTTNGVLITYLVDNGTFHFTPAQIGWLIGIPVLTGSLTRLPIGMLTDKFGGRPVYGLLLLISAVFMYLEGAVDSYAGFMWTGLGFGLTGAAFAVGIAYTSVWFSKDKQGLALGIFGAGNAGAALTSVGAPQLLNWFTEHGANPDNWRMLPKTYAAMLLVTGVVFLLFTHNRVVAETKAKTIGQLLAPLKYSRVWRFGLYYFLVFGGFMALAQWLIPYYVSAYGMSVALAGFLASIFSGPSGVIRAVGGWMSDAWGARSVMQWVLGICVVCFALLNVPRMDIWSPGTGVMARAKGVVTGVENTHIEVTSNLGPARYPLKAKQDESVSEQDRTDGVIIFPTSATWQEPVVKVGDQIAKKQLLAKGVTHVFFQANVWIFTFLVFVAGMAMGIGKAAVYRYIPDYFPQDVGVVGGMVGVLGGLGGFVCPIIFGYLMQFTGLWTTCWMFLLVLTIVCVVWMHIVVRSMIRDEAPMVLQHIKANAFATFAAERGGD
ncbi:MAG: NarK/NasA family nitrate transporter [Acidobacteria bacterium]|nr:NarK/NasA family nitrate transporter [Acidobacteriota bacterium]